MKTRATYRQTRALFLAARYTSERMRSRGMSAVEVMIAVMVAAAITIPILTLLFQERDTEQRSRFEYLALLAARDEMYQARMLIGMGADPKNVAHGLRQVKLNPLDAIGNTFFEGTLPATKYPAEMERVQVEVSIDGSAAGTPHVHPARVHATWLDPDAAKASGQAGRKSDVELQFGVLTPPWGAP